MPAHEMPLLYTSANKIIAFEDALTFFPSLFRLTKSIVVTEQLMQFSTGTDATGNIALTLKSNDPNLMRLNEKVNTLMKQEGLVSEQPSFLVGDLQGLGIQSDLVDDEDSFLKGKRNLSRKIST